MSLIPAIIAATGAIGAGMQIYGAMQATKAAKQQAKAAEQQGKAAEQQGKAEQQIFDYNASLKEQEATAARERAMEEARMFEERGRELQGTQKVTLAKGGVLSSEGTPALLMTEMARNLEVDRNKIIKEGSLAESTLRSEARGLRYEGMAAKARGVNANIGYKYSARGSLLTGRGNALAGYGNALTGFGNTYYNYKRGTN